MGMHELLREILTIFQTSTDGIAPPDSDLRPAALAAASEGRPHCLQLLLDSCTTPSSLTELLDTKDTSECTPLLMSAKNGHVECMRLLLELSPETQVAARDAVEGNECNALMHAACSGHTACMRLLLEHSPDVQVAATDNKAANALIYAANNGHASCIKLLLAHSPGIQVAAVDCKGCNALTHAAFRGHTACLQLLLAHSPDIQVATAAATAGSWGLSALMAAAGSRHTSCVQLLLAHRPGFQTAALSGSGRSALGHAAVNAHVDYLQLLLAHSPTQQQLDRALLGAGQEMSELQPPPAQQQRRQCLKECIELLLANGAMLTAQSSRGAIAAIRPINRGLAARAMVPNIATEAVLGLALAATCHKRQASGEDATASSQWARSP